MSFEDVPEELRALKQFCLRAEKQPYVKNARGGFSAKGWQADRERWLTFDEAIEALQRGVEVYHKDASWKVEGIGILIIGDGLDHPQFLGGDLDCCRDPETAFVSPWAREFLQKVKPFYTEVSPSGCGFRYFVMGKLPNGRYQITGFGPQKDLPKETIERILRAKPKARDKIIRGEPAFNGLEFHESGEPKNGIVPAKHLTITGRRIEEFCYPKEDRTQEINEALQPIIQESEKLAAKASAKPRIEDIVGPTPAWAQEMDKFLAEKRLPALSILKVIDTSGFEESGGQLFGPHPILGSTTGKNLVVNPAENQYCWMHNGINAGGDAYVWLAHEFCGVPWDVQGEGLLKDRVLLKKVVTVAAAKGLVDPALVIREPEIRTVSLADEPGAVGKYSDGTIRQVGLNRNGVKVLNWISDCAIVLHTETREDGITEFTFLGTGAKDGLNVCITLPATEMADPRKFRGALINAFGSVDQVGKLTFELVQGMSRYAIKKQRVTVPCWRKNVPLIPGLDLVNNAEYRLSSLTPAKVYDGDIKLAADVLRRFVTLRKYTPLLIIVVMGAPLYARWFPGDRFGLALWGKSGSHKTTIAKLACTIYGIGFYEEHALIKHGKIGGTPTGATEALLNAGILPRIIDDVKSTDPKDVQTYVAIIHAVMEGLEKLRAKKEGGLRKSAQFLTTPIITGEIRPAEASTSARVLNLIWAKADDSLKLAGIQGDMQILPIVGYHWLRFLASDSRDIRIGFEEARTKKYNEYILKNYVNAGRLATIYCLIRAVWALACESPFGEVFQDCTPAFMAALDEAIAEQGALVSEETEVAKFLTALNELVTTRPDLFMIGEIRTGADKILGRQNDRGLFVFPNETLAVMKQLGVFTQIPNVASLTNALIEEGVLIPAREKDHKLYQAKINNIRVRGWMLVPGWNAPDGDGNGDQKTLSSDPNTRKHRIPAEKEKSNFSEKNQRENEYSKENEIPTGTTGKTGTINDNIVIDIDYSENDGTRLSTQPVPGDFLANPNASSAIDPEAKQRLWIAIGHILKHSPRKEPGKLGLALADLAGTAKLPETQLKAILEASGWTSSSIEASGLIVWWAPEKVLKAYGLEAGP